MNQVVRLEGDRLPLYIPISSNIVMPQWYGYFDSRRSTLQTQTPAIMRATRKHQALVLTLTLVTGSVIAPLSHYIFMAAGDAFVAGHHAPASDHRHGTDKDWSGTLSSSSMHCDYDSLFASFSATPDSSPTSVVRPPTEEPHLLLEQIINSGSCVGLQSTRAPPFRA